MDTGTEPCHTSSMNTTNTVIVLLDLALIGWGAHWVGIRIGRRICKVIGL